MGLRLDIPTPARPKGRVADVFNLSEDLRESPPCPQPLMWWRSDPQTCKAPSIQRPRWCAGRCAARQRPERLQSFGTITLVLAMALQLAPSTNKVQLTPHARLAQPPRSLTPGCSLWMAGDHWTLRWKLFLMAAKRQHLASAWRRAGARAARHAHASVCAEARRGPRPRSGRRLVVEPADHRCLAGPPDPLPSWGGFGAPG